MLKFAILFGLEKLVEVEGVVDCPFLVQFHSLLHLLAHNIAHAVGEEVQPRHVLIRVVVVAVPACLGLLLVSVTPIENLLVGELVRSDGLERRAAEVEGESSLDIIEGAVGAHRIHPFVTLVHYQ